MIGVNLALYHDLGFSTAQIRAVENLILNNKLHWIQVGEDGIFELILDNQMMSDFRGCPSYFMLAHVEGIYSKGRSWDLEFGLWFHSMMELYYSTFRNKDFNLQQWGVDTGAALWRKMDLDIHSQSKGYNIVGGLIGAVGILAAYATRFSAENERLRIIGTEISFGKNKEVLLGLTAFGRLFLSGRIDTLVDDGSAIAPMDHKTMSHMRYDPAQRYELDEGPTGYVFAVAQILPKFLDLNNLDPSLVKRSCNKIYMNFISKQLPKDENERFKRLPLLKTQEQLEAYRQRMCATGDDIFRALIRYAEWGTSTRDTSKCTNWYMHDCGYLPIHRQNSKENEFQIINQFFEKREIWDTEKVGKGE